MIEDILAFKEYFYKPRYHILDFNSELLKNWDYNRNYYYYGLRNPATGKTDPPKILENITNKEQDLKFFMEIANNAGLNVFELDSIFNTFTQITMTNKQITRTQCK